MFDTILRGGEIYDGSGRPPFAGDVGVKDGKIAALGRLADAQADVEIDVKGLAVSPGFIDIHTHSDFTLMVNGCAESQVHQGVTTEVVGQCGVSCAPANCARDIEVMSPGYTPGCVDLGWRSFGDYLDHLEARPLGVNVVAFVGHGTIHRAVLGDQLRPANHDEVQTMARMVDEAMEQGAGGLSSGLEYWPGSVAAPEHIVPLVEIAAKHDVLYATHVRNRDIYYDLGFGEAMATARLGGARLQISHIQPKFGAPAYAMEHSIEMIDSNRRHGVDVAFDVIPHDWSHTSVVASLPSWAREGGVPALLDRLTDANTRERMKVNPKPIWRLVPAGRWDDIVLLRSQANTGSVGMTIAEIGKARGKDPFDAVFDLLLEEGENVSQLMWTSHSFQDSEIKLCLEQPHCAVMSDTLALAPYGALKDHIGSLAGYGWAARFLQTYVRDDEVMPLAEGIRRMTSLPAERLGLRDRGSLQPGHWADITVFDAQAIASHCTVREPRLYASGIAHVLVNGVPAMRDGERQESNTGSVLRRH